MRYLLPLIASAAAILGAPMASAEPNPTQPNCQSVAGGEYTGTGETECQSPGNVQIDATAPAPLYPYPWADEFYGAPLIIGGFGPHGGAPVGGGGHR
jgi:hypothetical protein